MTGVLGRLWGKALTATRRLRLSHAHPLAGGVCRPVSYQIWAEGWGRRGNKARLLPSNCSWPEEREGREGRQRGREAGASKKYLLH